jgi:hypothetical protein
MSKYYHEKFERNAHDLYDTPKECVNSLLRHIPMGSSFYEPCAGACVSFDEVQLA